LYNQLSTMVDGRRRALDTHETRIVVNSRVSVDAMADSSAVYHWSYDTVIARPTIAASGVCIETSICISAEPRRCLGPTNRTRHKYKSYLCLQPAALGPTLDMAIGIAVQS